MNKETKVIKCRNCGKEFEFVGGEQSFYEEKGFALPVRCKECRNARKEANLAKEVSVDSEEEFTAMLLKKFTENTVEFDSED